MSGYPFWLRITAILQLITAAIHSLSLFRNPAPNNDTEEQLINLMTTYRPSFPGGYFHPSMADLLTGLSSCFSFLYLLGGVSTLYLLSKNLSQETWKGLTGINLIVFGGSFLVMLVFTFLPPIVMTGLVFVGLSFAYATNHIHHIKLPKD